jgi:anti-sigma factor RsiW
LQDQAKQLRALKDAHLKTSAYVESEHTVDLERAAEKLARALGELEEERAHSQRKLDEARARHVQEIARLREEVEEEEARARAQVEEARRQAEEARREADERKVQQVRWPLLLPGLQGFLMGFIGGLHYFQALLSR